MVVVMAAEAGEAEVEGVVELVRGAGGDAFVSRGVSRTIVGLVGDIDQLDTLNLRGMPGVSDVVRITAPYKLVSREHHRERSVIRVAGVPIGPDTLTVIDIKAWPPKVVAELDVPGSVVGPPFSVAVSRDESLALVTANEKLDPADPTKRIPNNTMSVVDLKATPPRIIATLETGKAPAGVSINRAGTLALVANRAEGTVSVFTIQGKAVTPAGTVEVGGKTAGGGMVAITPDGKTALVSRRNDNKISVLSIDGAKVEYTNRDMTAGVRPIVLDIASNGAFGVVASLGGGASGDSDSISLIDLTAKPPRVVDTIGVLGATAEGLKIFTNNWNPANNQFGALAFIYGTAITAASGSS